MLGVSRESFPSCLGGVGQPRDVRVKDDASDECVAASRPPDSAIAKPVLRAESERFVVSSAEIADCDCLGHCRVSLRASRPVRFPEHSASTHPVKKKDVARSHREVYGPGMETKWTEGEVREALRREDHDAIREILQYVLERGDRVIGRGDMRLGMYEGEDE